MTEPSHFVKMVMLQAMAANLDQGEGQATMVCYIQAIQQWQLNLLR